MGEVGLDSLLDDGLFKDIPFISTGLSVSKLLRSLSDRILLSKIIHFINELQLKNQEEIDQFKQKYFKVKDYSTIGSKILLILERTDNDIKIKWLAKALNLFIDNEIDKAQFLRLSSIINSGYVGDIEQIKVFKKNDFIYSPLPLVCN